LAASCCFLILAVWLFSLVIHFIHIENNPALHPPADPYRNGFLAGICVGAFSMMLVVKVLWYFVESLNLLFGNRRDTLLVAYYDQLHPLDAKAPAPSVAE